jgi:hypothetical protein
MIGSVQARLAATLVLAALLVPSAQADAVPLRQVDWQAVLAADPHLHIESQPPLAGAGPYVSVVTPPAGDESGPSAATPSGYALIDGVQYGDLDGDGVEEAAIVLVSGGTAGAVGVLLYRADEPLPRLIASLSGYKLGAQLQDGALTLLQPRYAGFEANCCPSAEVETVYGLVGDQLVVSSETEQPLTEAQVETVRAYYTAIGRHALSEAYDFLSQDFQQTHPFEAWAAGFSDTQRVRVDQLEQTPTGVAVRLTAVDDTAAGARVARRFAGTWSLAWSTAAHRWLLDQASIVELP